MDVLEIVAVVFMAILFNFAVEQLKLQDFGCSAYLKFSCSQNVHTIIWSDSNLKCDMVYIGCPI